MPANKRAFRATAIATSAQLGGAERVLLDFAARAFEYDLALRVITPRAGPLIGILNEIGVPAAVVPASEAALGGLLGGMGWARQLAAHPFWRDADVTYTVALRAHLAVAARRKHPVVWHLHDMPPEWRGTIWRAMAKSIPDAMIANSEATADAWGKAEAGTGKAITVVPNGVDLDRFKPRERTGWIHERLGIPRGARLIGMPTVFARWKGQMEVIEAFSLLRDQFPGVHLVFVGGSIYETAAEDQFGEELRAALGERVHLLPFQPKIELVYPEFDVVLHYSVRPEPFGRVVLEAMASGVAVVAADEGGPVEILGKGGWLAVPRDVPGLATLLRQVLTLPPEELRAVGAQGRKRAEEHYSARVFAKKVAEVLRAAALEIGT